MESGNELSGILDILRQDMDLGMGSRDDTKNIGEPLKKDVVAIDGGSSTIWSNGIASIGVLRYGFVSYSPSFKVRKVSVKSEFVLNREGESSLDMERHRREVSMIKEASVFGDVVLFDGALSRIPDIGLEREVDAVRESSIVVGVSKNSTLSVINDRMPDIWLPLGPSSYRKVPKEGIEKMIEKRNLIEGAHTVYARFHEKGPSLRIDIAGDESEALMVLKHYSYYNLCPGYPFPLAEIHRLVCMDDKREIYEHKLRRDMEENGMGDIFLKGRMLNGRNTSNFHSTLDGLV